MEFPYTTAPVCACCLCFVNKSPFILSAGFWQARTWHHIYFTLHTISYLFVAIWRQMFVMMLTMIWHNHKDKCENCQCKFSPREGVNTEHMKAFKMYIVSNKSRNTVSPPTIYYKYYQTYAMLQKSFRHEEVLSRMMVDEHFIQKLNCYSAEKAWGFTFLKVFPDTSSP